MESLTSLALRSKAHWGYSPEFMAQCTEELRVRLDIRDTFFVRHDGAPAGFYSLENATAETIELEALFVDPPFIGKGLGRQLFRDAVGRARAEGAAQLRIQSDPNASDFYRRCGCRYVGTRKSGSIADRQLPMFVYDL